jgi:hypothetical protein
VKCLILLYIGGFEGRRRVGGGGAIIAVNKIFVK